VSRSGIGPGDGRDAGDAALVAQGLQEVHDGRMSEEYEVGPTVDLPSGKVTGAGPYAVGNVDGTFFAVSRHCRHLRADLAGGSIDADGRLVCPWHKSAYDVSTGRMVRGPQGAFAKVPGLGAAYKLLTKVLPLRRGTVAERDGCIFVR
jgi:nitrite reductase/ring-hydroxylating ferredoxin subunit